MSVRALTSESTGFAALPYVDPFDLLDDELRIVQARLQLIRASKPGRGTESPPDIKAAEALVSARLRISDRRSLPIAQLHSNFGLSATEERLLWILIANELCPVSRALLRAVNTEEVADPTTDALRRAVYETRSGSSAWSELSTDGTLRRLGLIERTDGVVSAPVHRQTWKVAERVLALVHGEITLDPALSRFAELRAGTWSHELVVSNGVRGALREACGAAGIVVAFGRAGSGRRSMLEAVLRESDRDVLQIDGRSIAKDYETARAELRAVARECALLGLVPSIRDLDALGAIGDVPDRIELVETELAGLVVGTSCRQLARRWRHGATQIELQPLSGAQRAGVWASALPTAPVEQADELATLYPLAPGLIHATGVVIRSQCGQLAPTSAQITNGLRSILDDRLAGLATRVTVTQTWDDMVLPEDQLAAIVELMSRIAERRTVYEEWGFADKVGKGLGVSALFSGPPGTGKTMAAGLIARDLAVEMYQVDLSKIVSKWIGETEKNLAALFDAAEAGHAILLFDEADALFGKRTDVRSSNDRHANQEVNFLLQRLESFAGIVILTTNHETAIDDAFRRRLSLRVQFPMPESDERLKLWHALLPKLAPTKGQLRLDRLAEHYEMSGGYIRNAVLRAAFLAAAEGAPITGEHLERAAQLEYEAMGKIATKL